jgi:hypothetical protein
MLSKALLVNYKNYSKVALNLKNYEYSDVFMNNYGDPIFNKNKILIGYKLNNNKYASVTTYYNDDNLLCNKIFIKNINEVSLSPINAAEFTKEAINS